jgi:hypothetical protein
MTGIDYYPKRTKFLQSIGHIIPDRMVHGELSQNYFQEIWKLAVEAGLQMPNELWVTLDTIGIKVDATPARIKSIKSIPSVPPENSQARQVFGEASPRKTGSTKYTSNGVHVDIDE